MNIVITQYKLTVQWLKGFLCQHVLIQWIFSYRIKGFQWSFFHHHYFLQLSLKFVIPTHKVTKIKWGSFTFAFVDEIFVATIIAYYCSYTLAKVKGPATQPWVDSRADLTCVPLFTDSLSTCLLITPYYTTKVRSLSPYWWRHDKIIY